MGQRFIVDSVFRPWVVVIEAASCCNRIRRGRATTGEDCRVIRSQDFATLETEGGWVAKEMDCQPLTLRLESFQCAALGCG